MSSDDLPTRMVKLPKLADVVARDLRGWIVRGVLKERDQLPTLERLSARFGVSLAVVREAVRILETEDLLEIRRGAKGGVIVKTPTLDVVARTLGAYLQFHRVTVEDLLTALMGMEPFAAARLAGNPTDAVIEALEASIAHAETCLPDPVDFASASAAFHEALVGLAGNRTMSVMHAAVHNIVEAESTTFADRRSKAPTNLQNRQKVVKSYRRLLVLIKAADAVGAEKHWRKHLETSTQVLLSLAHGQLIIDLFSSPDDAPPIIDMTPPSPKPSASAPRKPKTQGEPPPKRRVRRSV